jgi:hypothetical protein
VSKLRVRGKNLPKKARLRAIVSQKGIFVFAPLVLFRGHPVNVNPSGSPARQARRAEAPKGFGAKAGQGESK